MKKIYLLFAVCLTFCQTVSGQSYHEDFMRALNAKNMQQANEILKAWDMADSNDPDLYVAYFNFYTAKSIEKDSTQFDREYADQAIEMISEGIERFPTRFDMRVAKIFMYEQLKEYDAYTAEVIDLIDYSKKIGNNWKREGFRVLDQPAKIFEGAVQNFQSKLYSSQDTTLCKYMKQIAEKMIKEYPRLSQSYINMSTVYADRQQYDKSLEYLLKAKEFDATNTILLYNIAYVYNLKRDKQNAIKYFELAVANATSKETQLKDAAQKHLDELKK